MKIKKFETLDNDKEKNINWLDCQVLKSHIDQGIKIQELNYKLKQIKDDYHKNRREILDMIKGWRKINHYKLFNKYKDLYMIDNFQVNKDSIILTGYGRIKITLDKKDTMDLIDYINDPRLYIDTKNFNL